MKLIVAVSCICLVLFAGVGVLIASAEHPEEAALVAIIAIVVGATMTRR